MKFVLPIIFIMLLTFVPFAQQGDVQCVTYNEDNSSFSTSVCYNWNQLPTGELFVSGNAGLYRFDGVNFYPYVTRGRGVTISTSIADKNGRLWCNSFHGDVYYMEDDSLIRHPISNTIRGLTALRFVNGRLFLYTEKTLFEIDPESLDINFLREFSLIRTLFEANHQPYLLNSLEDDQTEVVNLATMQSSIFTEEFAMSSSCRFLKGEVTSYLFFDRDRTFLTVDDLLDGNWDKRHSILYEGKINHVTTLDNKIAVCGMNGITLYSNKGNWLKRLLPDIQVTHFGKDQEGSYLATSMTEGLIFIPDLNVYRIDYSSYLDHENIIKATFDQQHFVYLGTNAGKILRHNLITDKVEVIDLGLRSEVLSLQLSKNGKDLFAYCDNLYVFNAENLQLKKKLPMSSVKEMALYRDDLILGTRKGLELLKTDKFVEMAELGWIISLLPIEEKNELLVSSKNGLFSVNMSSRKTSPVSLQGIDSDRTISHLRRNSRDLFFIYDHQTVYQCSEDLKQVKVLYTHSKNDLNGLTFQEDKILLFAKGSVMVLNEKGVLLRTLNSFNGLNEKYVVDAFEFNNKSYFIHNESMTVYDGLPRTSKVQPEISFVLSENSSFKNVGGNFESDYEDNELVFRLKIRRALRSREQLEVFYCFDISDGNWKKIDNPYAEIRLERLPTGVGTIYFKAVNDAGVASSVVSVPYYVAPPFYQTIWFFLLLSVVLIVGIILITKWRVQLARKKTLERLQKEKLESRAMHAELTAIRSQMNPHFIFNVLTAIQAKVIQGKVDEAYTNIGDFAILIRNVLEKSGKEYISLDDEIALMKNYVELENSRLKRPVSLEVRVNNSDYFEDVFIPTLITQPLIENAIKHAFNEAVAIPKICLEAQANGDGFILSVSDNGVGFDLGVKEEGHDSFALSALRKRIQTLSQTAPYTINLSIRSDATGTVVAFTFKYKKK